MGLILFYFSGTGNTRYVAHHLCKRLSECGYPAEAVSIEGLSHADAQTLIDNETVVGLAWPIYGSDIPVNMREFIKYMPIVENKPLLTLCTQLMFSGDGAVIMRKELETMGYIQRWAVQFNMPNNAGIKGMPFKGYDDYARHEEKYLNPARRKIEHLKDNIINNTECIKGATIWHTILAMSQRPFFRWGGRKAMTKQLGVNDNCTGCGLCAQMCPKRVIKMIDGKAVHKHKNECLLCLRCLNFCPYEAVTFMKTVKKPLYKGPDEQTYKDIIRDKKA